MRPPRRQQSRQSGHEVLEFALVAILFLPAILGMFVTGMNMIRSIQANHIARDLANMYIHGADYSTHGLQAVAQRLSTGLDLEIGPPFQGNLAENTANGGRGLVTVSQFMWVGGETEPSCQAVLPAECTNHDSFVFTQRIRFGNGTLANDHPSSLGDPVAPRNALGKVQDPVVASGARVPGQAQIRLQDLWQSGASGTLPLEDGQIVYAIEVYYDSPDLNLGNYPGEGVYARWFF